MEVNTLVRHKKLKSLGIGCVSKVKKNKIAVNWGTDDTAEHTESVLIPIDTSKCKTVTMSEFRTRNITNDWDELVIIGNEVKNWVGIGWVSRGIVTENDLTKYRRLVQ